jgi:O-methyltransferase involved in polyketide biosynthesis
MYLTESAVRTTLGAIARLATPASSLAMTYVTPRVFERLGAAGDLSKVVADLIGEPFLGAIEQARIQALLEEAGFHLESDESLHEWGPRYWNEPAHEWNRQAREVERLAIASRAQAPRG